MTGSVGFCVCAVSRVGGVIFQRLVAPFITESTKTELAVEGVAMVEGMETTRLSSGASMVGCDRRQLGETWNRLLRTALGPELPQVFIDASACLLVNQG
jgi:hypothetical protein